LEKRLAKQVRKSVRGFSAVLTHVTLPSTLSKTGSSSKQNTTPPVHVVNGSEELKLAGPNVPYPNAMYVEYILCINFPKNQFSRTC